MQYQAIKRLPEEEALLLIKEGDPKLGFLMLLQQKNLPTWKFQGRLKGKVRRLRSNLRPPMS